VRQSVCHQNLYCCCGRGRRSTPGSGAPSRCTRPPWGCRFWSHWKWHVGWWEGVIPRRSNGCKYDDGPDPSSRAKASTAARTPHINPRSCRASSWPIRPSHRGRGWDTRQRLFPTVRPTHVDVRRSKFGALLAPQRGTRPPIRFLLHGIGRTDLLQLMWKLRRIDSTCLIIDLTYFFPK